MTAHDQHGATESRAALGPLLGILSQLYVSRIGALLAPQGLTYTQFSLLHHLSASGAPQTVTQLAESLEIGQPGVTKVVQKLAAQGFVATTASRDDHRRKLVTISASGRKLLDQAGQEIDLTFAGWFDGWSADEFGAFSETVRQLIERIGATLDATEPGE